MSEFACDLTIGAAIGINLRTHRTMRWVLRYLEGGYWGILEGRISNASVPPL